MSLPIPSNLQAYVDRAVVTGKFSSPEDVVAEALRRMQEQDAKETQLVRLRERIALGLAQIERGEVIDSEEVFRQLEAKYPGIFDGDDDEDASCP
jgi:antitoxin ParD1/3/4